MTSDSFQKALNEARRRQKSRKVTGRAKIRWLFDQFSQSTGTGPRSPCWIWPGWDTPAQRKRYAQVMVNGKNMRAHRVMWEEVIGPIPDGHVVDHTCEIKACINPWHLEPVQEWVNVTRSARPRGPRNRTRRKQAARSLLGV